MITKELNVFMYSGLMALAMFNEPVAEKILLIIRWRTVAFTYIMRVTTTMATIAMRMKVPYAL